MVVALLVMGTAACSTASEPDATPTQLPAVPTLTPIPDPRNTPIAVAQTPEQTTPSTPTATLIPPTPTPTPMPGLSQGGVRSVLVAQLLTELLMIQVPFPKVQVGSVIEGWDIFALYWGAGVWEVSGPGLRRHTDSQTGVEWVTGQWWVTEDARTASPADPPASFLADYLDEWTLARPTPTPVPTATPTPTPTPVPTCDVESEVIVEKVLGTMNDPLRLRADIDVALRNTCTISVTVELEGVVLGGDGQVRGRQAHFLPVTLPPGELIAFSVLVLGDFWVGSELEYRVEVTPVD